MARGERPRSRPPPASFHARHGNGQRRLRRDQDRQVDDAVLLGADELLAIDDQRRAEIAIDDTQLGNPALLRHLGDLEKPVRQPLVQHRVEGRGLFRRCPPAGERNHREVLKRDRRSEDDRVQRIGDG